MRTTSSPLTAVSGDRLAAGREPPRPAAAPTYVAVIDTGDEVIAVPGFGAHHEALAYAAGCEEQGRGSLVTAGRVLSREEFRVEVAR